jgi:hypothetical protein
LDCFAPELSYYTENYASIPLGTFVSDVPMVRSDVPNDYNKTVFDEAIASVDETLRANGIELDSINNSMSSPGSFQLLKFAARTNRTPNGKARWAMQGFSRSKLSVDPFTLSDAVALKQKRGYLFKMAQGFSKPKPSPANPLDHVSRDVEYHVRTHLWKVEADAHSARRKLLQVIGPGPLLPNETISRDPATAPGTPANPFEPAPTNELPGDLVSFRQIAAISVGLSIFRSVSNFMSTYLALNSMAKAINTAKIAANVGTITASSFRGAIFLPLVAFEVLNFVLEFSGQSPVQQLAKYVRAIVTSLIDFGNGVVNFQRATVISLEGLNAVVDKVVIGVNQLRSEVQGINNDLQILSAAFNQSQRNFDKFVNLTTDQFRELDDRFVQTSVNQVNITNILLSLIRKGYQQNDVAMQAVVQLDQKVNALRDIVGMVDRRTVDLRAATALFHEQLNATRFFGETTAKMRPFMSLTGRKPLSATQLRQTKNVANAIDVATVEIQGSYRVTSGLTTNVFAAAYTLTAKCDLEFMAQQHQTDPSFGFLFDNVGPGNSSSSTTCSGVDGTASPWSCYCIVVANGSTAQYANPNPTFLYPWNVFTQSTALEQYHQQRIWINYPSIFPFGTVALPPVYLDTPEKLANFLGGPEICTERNWLQKTVRMVNPGTLRYSNISTDDSLFPQGSIDRCNATYQVATGLQRSFNVTTIPQSYYFYSSQEFGIVLEPKARIANDIVYGQLGQSVITEYLGNMATSSIRAYRTYLIRFASLLVDRFDQVIQLMVFVARYATTSYRLQIQLNSEQPVIHDSYQVATTTTVRRNDSVGGNITIATDVSASIIENGNLAVPVMPLISTAMFQCPGPQFFVPSVEDPTDCDYSQPTLFTDYNWNDIKFGPIRDGAYNYIQNLQSVFTGKFQENLVVGLNVPMNRSTFDMQNSLDFDPTAARNTPLASQRYIPLDSDFCQQQYDPYTQTLVDPAPDKDYCTFRRFFNIPKVLPYDMAGIGFTPRKWNTLYNLKVPVGEIVQIISTRCPDSFDIDYVKGNSFATVRFRSTSDITVKYSVCAHNYVSCLRYNVQANLGPNAPLSISVTGMLPAITYYVQVWQYQLNGPDPSATCFNGTGVPIIITANATGVPGMPVSLQNRVIAVVSGTNLDTLRYQQVSAMFTEIHNKMLFGAIDQVLVNQVEDLIDQIQRRLNESLISAEDEAVVREILETSARLQKMALDIVNSTALRDLRLQAQAQYWVEVLQDLQENRVWIAWMDFFANRTQASLQNFFFLLDKMGNTPQLPEFLDVVGDTVDAIKDGIPSPNIGDMLDDVMGWGKGIANIIGAVIMVIIIIVIIVLSVQFCKLAKEVRENNGSLGNAVVSPAMKEAALQQAEELEELQMKNKQLEERVGRLEQMLGNRSGASSTKPTGTPGRVTTNPPETAKVLTKSSPAPASASASTSGSGSVKKPLSSMKIKGAKSGNSSVYMDINDGL